MSDPTYLTNQLLIAMPTLDDPHFAQTVALVCDHGPYGALALILNRPLPLCLAEVLDGLETPLDERKAVEADPLRDQKVLKGGPVQANRGFVIHQAGRDWDSTIKVSTTIHVTTSRDILASMARGEGPTQAVLALGYAGWEGGQLEAEIRANAWLNAPVDTAIIFTLPFESRWQAAGRLLGFELSRISPQGGHA